MVQIEVKRIRVPPGQRVQLENITWLEFEAILAELGNRSTRIAYSEGILEIMAPLPEHETAKVFIGDFVKILLNEMNLDWISLGSTTFKQQLMAVGIEPDDCFYIQNCLLMVGRERLDLSIDLPPDLAIEIDVTSKTQISAYKGLRVPEIWCYDKGNLQINVLQSDVYINTIISPIFGDLPLVEIIPQFIKRGQTLLFGQQKRNLNFSVKLAIH